MSKYVAIYFYSTISNGWLLVSRYPISNDGNINVDVIQEFNHCISLGYKTKIVYE